MANRFLPIYLFLLLLGTAAPLWAQGSPEPRCIYADEDEEKLQARYGGGPWSIQGKEMLCFIHSEFNSEFTRKQGLPPLPGGVQLDPDMTRLIQFEIAKKTFRDCMIELVHQDPAEVGVDLSSDINAVCECNRRIYGVEFECRWGSYSMLSEGIPKRFFHEFMERKNDSETQCIAVLGFNFFHKGRNGQCW